MARTPWFVAFSLVLALACDGSSSGAPDGGSQPTADAALVDDARIASDAGANDASEGSDATANDDTTLLGACRSYFQALCGKYVACDFRAPASCVLDAMCPDMMFAPGSNWTVASARSCTAEWSKLSCADLAQERRPSCDALQGSFEVGHSCIVRMQCQSGACSAGVQHSGKCGQCSKVTTLGESCDFGAVVCPPAQNCEGGKCVERPWLPRTRPQLAAGEACTIQQFCESGLGCSLDDAGPGTCVTLPGPGAPCLQRTTGLAICAPESVCDTTSGKCMALPKAGEPCRAQRCDRQSYCAGTLTGNVPSGEVCVPRKGAGERCDKENFLEPGENFIREMCAAGLECMHAADVTASTVCATPRQLGESCDDSRERCRYGMHCLAGSCAANTESTLYETVCTTP